MLLRSNKYTDLISKLEYTMELFNSLGFKENREKSILQPSNSIKHLGFELDSTHLSISIPEEKCNDIEMKCKQFIAHKGSLEIRV